MLRHDHISEIYEWGSKCHDQWPSGASRSVVPNARGQTYSTLDYEPEFWRVMGTAAMMVPVLLFSMQALIKAGIEHTRGCRCNVCTRIRFLFSDTFVRRLRDRTEPIFFVCLPCSALVLFSLTVSANFLKCSSDLSFSMELFSTPCLKDPSTGAVNVGASIVSIATSLSVWG